MPTIGIIHSGTPGNNDLKKLVDVFISTLAQEGFVDGQAGFSIVSSRGGPVHWGDDDPAVLDGHAKTFVAGKVDVLVAAGGTRSAQIANQATQNTPLVFTSVTPPVRTAA